MVDHLNFDRWKFNENNKKNEPIKYLLTLD